MAVQITLELDGDVTWEVLRQFVSMNSAADADETVGWGYDMERNRVELFRYVDADE